MKQILSVAAVSLAFVVSAGAQGTPQSQSQSQSTSSASGQKSAKSQKKSSDSVTLTGCLRQGPSENSFELQNVEMTGSSASSAAGSGSSASSGSAAGSGTSTGTSGSEMGNVKLIVSDDIDLKPHVGHRVEVRGSMAGGMTKDKGSSSASDTMGSGSSASSSSATGTSGAGKDTAGKERALRVRSLRHISDTCS